MATVRKSTITLRGSYAGADAQSRGVPASNLSDGDDPTIIVASPMREETLFGRDYLVVPVVGIVGDIVVWPLESTAGELIPLSVVAESCLGWNGRPVLPDHPISIPDEELERTRIANTPVCLEKYQTGMLFNARVEKSLRFEAWLDKDKCLRTGYLGKRMLERCMAGEVGEISVGAIVTATHAPGIWQGEPYEWVWTDILPDHLAILPEGVEGACSVKAGCGTNRYLSRAKAKALAIKAKEETIVSDSSDNATNAPPTNALPTNAAPTPPTTATTTVPSQQARPTKESMTRFLSGLKTLFSGKVPRLLQEGMDQAQEQAELVLYQALSFALTQATDSIGSAGEIIQQMILAESPGQETGETPEDETAERTLEMAQLSAVWMLCMGAVDSLYSCMSTCSGMLYDMRQEEEKEEAGDQPTAEVIVISGDILALAGRVDRHLTSNGEVERSHVEITSAVHNMAAELLGLPCNATPTTNAKGLARPQIRLSPANNAHNQSTPPAPCGCQTTTTKENSMAAPNASATPFTITDATTTEEIVTHIVSSNPAYAASRNEIAGLSRTVLVAMASQAVPPVATPSTTTAVPAANTPPAQGMPQNLSSADIQALLSLSESTRRAGELRAANLRAFLCQTIPGIYPNVEALQSRSLPELEELAKVASLSLPAETSYGLIPVAPAGGNGGTGGRVRDPKESATPSPLLTLANAALAKAGQPALVVPGHRTVQ